MIAFLQGKLVESYPTHLIMDVNGVGYLVQVPLTTFEKLPLPPAEVRLMTFLQVREDAHTLFGFATAEERDLFKLLVDYVDGLGPKMALSVLSGMPVSQFRQAILNSDSVSLSRIKGVGKKTAERIVLELRDRMGVSEVWKTQKQATTPTERHRHDAIMALITLGYKQVDAQKAVTTVQGENPTLTTEEMIRSALKLL
ncbi:MAG: Holliday junction branch migration protein RuvA [Verrucomicrobiota bacterium]